MYRDAKQWQEIRYRVLECSVSKRQILRETGMSWHTLEKILTFPLPQPYKRRQKRNSQIPLSRQQRNKDQIWQDVLDALATASSNDARAIVSSVSAISTNHLTAQRLATLRQKLEELGYGQNGQKLNKKDADHAWMHNVMQGNISTRQIHEDVGNVECLDQLVAMAKGDLRQRNRAIAVLAQLKRVPLRSIARFLCISPTAVLNYQRRFRRDGINGIALTYRTAALRKAERDDVQDAVFSVLHTPPSQFKVNRTSWTLKDLRACLLSQGHHISRDVIREVVRSAGYRWRKAKTVLTSPDPLYREKLNRIQSILSNLQEDEVFFSIDEFGPFSIKMKGGKRLVGPMEYPYVPQLQKSKGFLIVTAALELSTNQVTHFYSWKKNTVEMLRLLYLLLDQYRGYRAMYFSWDAASWHSSRRLDRHVNRVNALEYRKQRDTPLVELAPLPASAQFLNVIESVFSGMSKAIIHNSDYRSVSEAMSAIDLYFAERNDFFRANPQRAGNKIWGKELVAARFGEAQNCKDPRW